MTSVRFPGSQIQSWNPAIDVRAVEAGRLFVLEGKNYLFDAKGPKSGFGSRLVRGGAVGNVVDVQSVDVGRNTLIMSSGGVWRQEYAIPAERDVLQPTTKWNRLLELTPDGDTALQFGLSRWTGAFLNGISYVANRYQGLFRVSKDRLAVHRRRGVPEKPIAITELASRLCVVNREAFSWSGPGDGKDFVPALGGAGFQRNNQYMAGIPLGLTKFEQGCVVWGGNSAMVVEFIGGDNVFRFDSLSSKLFPVGPLSITTDAQGNSYMMTRKGIVKVTGTKIDDEIVPAFNEFIRPFLNANWDTKVRLDYILEDDLLFIQLADSNNYFSQTYVLSVAIDKWGVFSETHLGVCRFGSQRGATGFTDVDGFVRKWTQTADRELPNGHLVGLDSYVDIGYFSPPDMVYSADAILEMQELMISAVESFPPEGEELIIDLMGLTDNDFWVDVNDSTDSVIEDWQTVSYEFVDSPGSVLVPAEDWGAGESYTEDWQFASGDNDEDWGLMVRSLENWSLDQTESGAVIIANEDWNDIIFPDISMVRLDFLTQQALYFNATEGYESVKLDFLGDTVSYSMLVDDWNVTSIEREDWNSESVYHAPIIGADEDWNAGPQINEDWVHNDGLPSTYDLREPNEDWNVMSIEGAEDWQFVPDTTHVIKTPDIYNDWNDNTGDEDYNGPYSLLNHFSYKLMIMASMNGKQWDNDVEPSLSWQRYNRDLWTMFTSGRFQAMRISATERWEKYHVTQVDASIIYQGQLS